MTNKIFVSVLSCLLAVQAVKAQYADILHPQSDDQGLKMKAVKSNFKSQFIEMGGNEAAYAAYAYDNEGRIMKVATPKRHQLFTYNDKGQVSELVDSVNDGRRFERFDYHFEYDANGRLSSAVLGKKKAVFAYDAAKRELVETVSGAAGMLEKHVYHYTEENKLSDELFTSTAGEELRKHKLLYNKYGDLASEILVEKTKTGKDSSSTLYTYDGKGRLIDKKYTLSKITLDVAQPSTPKVEMRREAYSYTFNPKGQLGLITMTCSDGKDSYKQEYMYDNDGIISTETIRELGGKVIRKYSYRYSHRKV